MTTQGNRSYFQKDSTTEAALGKMMFLLEKGDKTLLLLQLILKRPFVEK
ncbi:MAG: hypothetical protein R2776_01305 [Flavobacteriaceae bacterium]